ncbi:MAG TPA: DNA mismatch repair protein MutT, partial [Gemmobacter sp.]|nr:DNA mismatch repair protein MutT [Gemmobacter sp.]
MSIDPPIRDAATLILSRQGPDGPEVLMGQRGAGAAFMPSKYVFPGGAVDAGD